PSSTCGCYVGYSYGRSSSIHTQPSTVCKLSVQLCTTTRQRLPISLVMMKECRLPGAISWRCSYLAAHSRPRHFLHPPEFAPHCAGLVVQFYPVAASSHPSASNTLPALALSG